MSQYEPSFGYGFPIPMRGNELTSLIEDQTLASGFQSP